MRGTRREERVEKLGGGGKVGEEANYQDQLHHHRIFITVLTTL